MRESGMPPGNAGGCRAIVEPWYAGSRRNGRRTRRSRPLRRDRPRRAPDVSSVESSSLRRATRPMRSSSPSGAALPEGVVRSLPCWPAVGLRVTSAVERQRALATSPLAGWFGRLTALRAAWSIGGRLRFRSWRERRMSSRLRSSASARSRVTTPSRWPEVRARWTGVRGRTRVRSGWQASGSRPEAQVRRSAG
jgi:hypothetical protein